MYNIRFSSYIRTRMEEKRGAINGIRALLMPERVARVEHLSGIYRQFAVCETKNTDAIISRKGHTRRTSAHTSCEISRNIELSKPEVELSDREERPG